MNLDLLLDAQVYSACVRKFGFRRFMAAHRNGETGFHQPESLDIARFLDGFAWTKQQLKGDNLSNDLRFWVNIPAI